MDNHNHDNHNNSGKFLNGLMLGALLGAGAVYLLSTEKGKKILKAVTEYGLEGITEVDDMLDEEMEEEAMSTPTKKAKTEGPEIIENITNKTNITGHARRIFKGITKKKKSPFS